VSQGDTEVLLHLLIREGLDCLHRLNGFFAFAFYDKQNGNLLIARDRYGIKPLHYYSNSDTFLFGSELKAILPFGVPKQINRAALHTYFQLSYIPAPHTIFEHIYKLRPGHALEVNKSGQVNISRYYRLEETQPIIPPTSYAKAKVQLRELVEKSVARRMIADVPVGTFLSGGIDSSIISATAAAINPQLSTFSIGFKDEPLFDESRYAEIMAKKLGTNHTTFQLGTEELFAHLHDVLDYQDEPFADSSALAVSYLSKQSRQHVAVALSGDGADELFTGYNKHKATYYVQQKRLLCKAIAMCKPLWQSLPRSRNGKLANLNRQLLRLSEGMHLTNEQRYWKWASFYPAEKAETLLLQKPETQLTSTLLQDVPQQATELEQMLLNDLHLVLADDMLTKVDRMSMCHGLEVRVPFLDHKLVEYVNQLPLHYKINGSHTKRILRESFENELPETIRNRKKHGFEVPLLKWFRTDLKAALEQELFNEDYIQNQGIFAIDQLQGLKQQLHSSSPGDAVSAIWSLFVFNHWWKKHMS
jgi:asparagine synthase (glutamine-hydrolysing)